MSKTTFLGYVPSLKSKHEATIVGHKAIKSKGGSIRYTLQGEYDGRKTLPKTVSKADFEGVYGFDAKEAEAVIIAGVKDGTSRELAYIEGMTDKDGFTTEVVTAVSPTKEGIEGAIKAGYYSNHAETVVGNPSPASVEPHAPAESPFPQEPSNENFSAEYTVEMIDEMSPDSPERFTGTEQQIKDTLLDYQEDRLVDMDKEDAERFIEEWDKKSLKTICDQDGLWDFVPHNISLTMIDENFSAETKDNFFYEIFTWPQEEIDKYGWENFYLDGKREDGFDWQADDDFPTYVEAVKAIEEINKKTPLAYAAIWEWDKETVVHTWPDGTKDLGQYTDNYNEIINTDPDKLEVKEAFLGFGKKDEEEESEEPKTQEFTVVLQEGDKLELTDIEEDEVSEEQEETAAPDEPKEEDSPEESENEEKEAEGMFLLKDIEWETDGEDVDLPTQVWIPNEYYGDAGEPADWLSDNYGFLVVGGYADIDTLDDKLFEAVQAKVTRPVKEDETEDEEESDEGLSTGAKVALGVGALAAGVALFGAEDDDYILYESETNYSRIYEAASGDSDYDDYLDELEEDALVLYKDNPSQLFEKAYPIDYEVGMNDYESSLLADIQSGHTENSQMFDEDENLTPYGERVLKEMYDSLIDESLGIEWLASRHPPSEILKRGDPIAYRVGMSEYEDGFESESDGFTYAYSKGHKDGMKDEVVYRPSIDTDREKNIYKKILRQKAETFEATGQTQYKIQFDEWPLRVHVDGCPLEVGNAIGKTYTADEIAQESYQILYEHESLPKFRGNTFGELRKASSGLILPCNCTINEMKVVKELDPATFKRHPNETQEHWSDTVGSPSPSGPSSTPEPAEATGSEPSNENMEAEGSNMKMALGILGVGVGAVALLGGERIKKIFEKLGL